MEDRRRRRNYRWIRFNLGQSIILLRPSRRGPLHWESRSSHIYAVTGIRVLSLDQNLYPIWEIGGWKSSKIERLRVLNLNWTADEDEDLRPCWREVGRTVLPETTLSLCLSLWWAQPWEFFLKRARAKTSWCIICRQIAGPPEIKGEQSYCCYYYHHHPLISGNSFPFMISVFALSM